MTTASPHLYRSQGAALGVPREIIERALEQAKPPERKRLPAILTLRHLGHQTGADYAYLREVVSRQRSGYRQFIIAKRRGGGRLIAAPEPTLAAVQRWILREILASRPVHNSSHAYAPGSSPIRCAAQHLGARWLIKIDIHDFFESISERSVYFVFRQCGYQALVAFELARLCTRVTSGRHQHLANWQSQNTRYGLIQAYRSSVMGHLPQGAPTSPMLSNLVVRMMDEMLQTLADRSGLTYTRYSDDIAFSTATAFDKAQAKTLIRNAERIFTAFGFALHRQKITIAPPGARKLVLGLVVDGERLRLPREFRDRIRDHVRGIETFGLAPHVASRHFASIWGFVRHLEGLLIYATAVDGDFAAPLRQRLADALEAEKWSASAQ